MNPTTEVGRQIPAVDVLARALRGRTAPSGTLASGTEASPAEGLALMTSFLAIKDAALRQALLDVAATLAAPRREH